MSLRYSCKHCGYKTNRKWSFEDHCSRPSACEKRLKRYDKKSAQQNIYNIQQNVSHPQQNISFNKQNISSSINQVSFSCKYCSKVLSTKQRLDSHEKACNGLNPLQCPTCKVFLSNAVAKSRHIRKGNCELVLTEEQQKIKDLEEQLEQKEQALEESEAKRKEAENSKSTINNYITNNTNNYFDHSINYNNYDNLNVDHITKDDIKRLFKNCRMQYPELSEDLTRMILSPKENQCIFLPEGQKSNTCAVIKDGVEMRKPLIRVLMDLGVQTATLIRDSNVIVRNKKDVVNNQFWADNRNACGLNISDIEYMTDNDKEIVQRNKNIVLDMCDGKI